MKLFVVSIQCSVCTRVHQPVTCVCWQSLRRLAAAEMEASGAAAEATDRSAGDGAERRPRGQKPNPGQSEV